MNDEYLNKIIKIDCIDGMKLLDTTSIDVIIADPPYNIGKDFGNNISKKENALLKPFQKEGYDESWQTTYKKAGIKFKEY